MDDDFQDLPNDSATQEMEALEMNEAEYARHLFKQNTPYAALEIARIMQHGETDRIRLDASKVILDRGLGKAQGTGDADVPPLQEFLELVSGKLQEIS